MHKKILIVDDNTGMREMYYEFFSRKGYTALTAPGGKEAIEIIQKENPDLVLLDMKMPKMDGIQTLKTIRASGMNTKVVMLTAVDSVDLERVARLNGASGFLRKELNAPVIVHAVDEIFADKPHVLKGDRNKVLVVDDDPRIRDIIEQFLTKRKFTSVSAASGEEALEKIKKENPIVVLLDVKMPGMDGLITLKKIREISEDIGVIMISGVGEQSMAEEAIKLGAYDYIVKPLDFDYLEMCLMTKIMLLSADNV
jgi:DNA-binding NtrC family response regulator